MELKVTVPPLHLVQLHVPALCSVPRKLTQSELYLCQALTNFSCQLTDLLYSTRDVASPPDFSSEQLVTRKLSDAKI